MKIAVPSIDVLGGKAVRLRQGKRGTSEVLGEPIGLAGKYSSLGFPYLHVVDLDAAFGGKSQLGLLPSISAAAGRMRVQWGGGIRTAKLAKEAADAGAARVVFGTAVFTAPSKVEEAVCALGAARVWASLDFAGEPPAAKVSGWTKGAGAGMAEAIEAAEKCGVGGAVISSVDADGMMNGPDLQLAKLAAAGWKKPFWLSGGMRNATDAKAAFEAGAQGAIFGRALYSGINLEGLACLQNE